MPNRTLPGLCPSPGRYWRTRQVHHCVDPLKRSLVDHARRRIPKDGFFSDLARLSHQRNNFVTTRRKEVAQA